MTTLFAGDTAKETTTVLSPNFGKGPLGLGDPNDKSLRHVEKEILIPKKMREKAKEEKCTDVVKAFEACCKASGLLMVIKCRAENSALKRCLEKWYNDEQFRNECTEEYLAERSLYRQTGQKSSQKRKESTTF